MRDVDGLGNESTIDLIIFGSVNLDDDAGEIDTKGN